jgi:hypothetical protein
MSVRVQPNYTAEVRFNSAARTETKKPAEKGRLIKRVLLMN